MHVVILNNSNSCTTFININSYHLRMNTHNVNSNNEYGVPEYNKIIEITPQPFYHNDLKNTLETIVFKDKPETEKAIVERVFSDKSKSLKSTVKALLEEVKLRETAYSEIFQNSIRILSGTSFRKHLAPQFHAFPFEHS